MIPMVDLKTQYKLLQTEIDAALASVLTKCRFILGPNVESFESEAAAHLGAEYAISCASGTDALHIALRALDIKPGDEIITTAFTFAATAEAISYVGAKPVFVDIDPKTFNIDPALIPAAVTAKTKALLPVHLFGQPANMPALQELAEKHSLHIIEDCAQSFGASIQNRMTGTFGDLGCFSFFPSKNLGCFGDGGMLSTNSEQLAQRIKLYRNHGSEEQYHHTVVGYNSRLDEIQAAVLRIKLKHIERFNEQRRHIAEKYTELLAETPVKTPHTDNIGKHVYHQYTVLLPKELQRAKVIEYLQTDGIASAIYYPIPLHQQQAFATTDAEQQLPVSEETAQRCLSLPIFPEMTDAQINQVCERLTQALTR